LVLVVSMAVYLLRLGCCLATTIQPDTPPTFKSLKHQIQS
jgi:quinol-cytochrome oxidoreductase complex cytochrome b subunit